MKKHNALISGPYLIWTAAFIVIPLLLIVWYGLTTPEGNFTLSNVAEIARPEWLKSLWLALLLSLVSTAICLVLAYPQ